MTSIVDFHDIYKDLIILMWTKYHIIPDDTIQYLTLRQLGRRKAKEFLDTKLKKVLTYQYQNGEYDEEYELKNLRAKVLEDINKELKENPLKWK